MGPTTLHVAQSAGRDPKELVVGIIKPRLEELAKMDVAGPTQRGCFKMSKGLGCYTERCVGAASRCWGRVGSGFRSYLFKRLRSP